MPLDRIAPPAPAPVTTAEVWRARRRPVALGVGTAAVLALVTWKVPAAGLPLAGVIAGMSWRLRASRLSPWRTPDVSPVPIDVADPARWTFARNLVWRWDDACVNAGLGAFTDDRYTYAGLALVGFTEREDGVLAHARLDAGRTADAVVAAQGKLAAGLEASSVTVVGGDGATLALLVEPVQAAGEWT